MAKRVLIVTGDAGESYEALYAVHRLAEAHVEGVVAAPAARRLHLVMHDFEPGWDTYIERPGYGLEAHLSIDAARAGDFDAILLLGGRAPEYLRHNQHLITLVKAFAAQNKWIFALCHGIQILAAAGLCEGRNVTCYENCRSEAEQAGGSWVAEQAVRDGHIVTGQTWQSHPEFYRLVFECLSQS